MSRSSFRQRLRRFTYLRRRSLVALAAGLAVLAALRVLAPPAPDYVSVLAASHDLTGGTTLQASDLTWVDVPREAVPNGALTTMDAAVGQTVNGPLSTRSPVTETSVSLGQQLAEPGYVVASLPLTDDALLALLQPGVRLDLLSTADGSVMAQNVRVVASPVAVDDGFTATQPVVLVEVKPDVAGALAMAAQTGGVVIAVH